MPRTDFARGDAGFQRTAPGHLTGFTTVSLVDLLVLGEEGVLTSSKSSSSHIFVFGRVVTWKFSSSLARILKLCVNVRGEERMERRDEGWRNGGIPIPPSGALCKFFFQLGGLPFKVIYGPYFSPRR